MRPFRDLLALAALSTAPDLARGFAPSVHPDSGARSYSGAEITRHANTATGSRAADAPTDPMFIEPLAGAAAEGRRSPDELIAIAKHFLLTSQGLGGDPDLLAANFEFEGPVVGPLSKEEFVQAIGSVDFAGAFPRWTPQFYGFFVDPLEEGGDRVWYTARGRGTNEGPLPPFAPAATGRAVENPPQVCSLTVDHATGLITRYTIGYVVDRAVGNTGGLGGLYGILYALGKPLPFPEAQPWKMSWQYGLFQKLGSLLS